MVGASHNRFQQNEDYQINDSVQKLRHTFKNTWYQNLCFRHWKPFCIVDFKSWHPTLQGAFSVIPRQLTGVGCIFSFMPPKILLVFRWPIKIQILNQSFLSLTFLHLNCHVKYLPDNFVIIPYLFYFLASGIELMTSCLISRHLCRLAKPLDPKLMFELFLECVCGHHQNY